MRRFFLRCVIMALVVIMLCTQNVAAFAEYVSRNPLLVPQQVPVAKTQQRYTNILLLGIDFGFTGYLASGRNVKKTLEDCHTDAVLVLSINMTTSDVNLISLPRDTVTYVPGVHGIYKLNGAFNCAETLDEGFSRICDAASWLLGGISIDHYCAVDMEAMIALGDFIGGVDLDVKMDYKGNSGKYYQKGKQHLDGMGIMDYVRARKNATLDGHDIGRTGRQRQAMIAIFQKIRRNAGLIKDGWDYANSGEINFFTDLSLAKVLNLLNKVKNADEIGSYVITGDYRGALNGWNFTFTDQANRIDVIKNVYGIEVEEIPYVSYRYTEWLMEEGMHTAQYISVSEKILTYAETQPQLTEQQQKAVDALRIARDDTAQAFDAAADTMLYQDNSKMITQRRNLLAAGKYAYELLGYPDLGTLWQDGTYWYYDTNINEYQYSWQ